jgi:twitching motility two-component system response regulator PilG
MATALNQRLRDGIAAAQAKQFDKARALLQPVAKASPNDALPWFWLAIASPSADAAINCLRRVLAIEPSHPQARAALAKLLVTQAGAAALAGNREEACAIATEATGLTPDIDTTWLALAAVTDDRIGRVEALRRAFAVNPAVTTRTRLRQALLYHATVTAKIDRVSARELFREVATLDPDDVRIWHALAQLADTPGDALAAVRELVRLAPNQAAGPAFLKKALVADARALDADGKTEDACVCWREVVELDDHDIDAWLGLAQSTEDEAEAQRAIERAFDLDPMDERVTSAMARLHDVPLDPAAFEPPPDAFSRLEMTATVFDRVDPTLEMVEELDLSVDPFARFAPTPKPAAAAAESEPEEASAPESAVEEVEIAIEEAVPVAAAPPPPPPPAPIVMPKKTPAPAPAAAAPAPAPGSNGSRKTVMVVDDSPTIRKILGLTLERAGYKVVAEPDGESAVERLTQIVPDVILLDIAMPKLDGYEVCKRIKKDARTAHVPVVMLSGKDALFDKVKGKMAGASEYLTKPFETPAVLNAVSTACHPPAEVVNG